jgi:hypothetical protein
VLILDMIEILPLLGEYKYDNWRILLVKCYIDNSVHLWSCIRNVNKALLPPIDDLETLVLPISNDEIDVVVWNLKIDKSPRPDGFNTYFMKKCRRS